MDLMTAEIAATAAPEADYYILDESFFRAMPFHYVETAQSRQRVFTVSRTSRLQTKTTVIGSPYLEESSAFPIR